MTQRPATIASLIAVCAISASLGCAHLGSLTGLWAAEPGELLIVDCLLPGKVKRLGNQLTYLTARRPAKTTANDCAIRGGEYTEYDRASYATALKVWLAAAQKGDPQAQTYVGEIYEKGLGLMPDYEAAALWYTRAAEQGFAPAQINLGQLYELGRGVRRDPKQALAWYRRASGLGDLEMDFKPSVVSDTEKLQLRQDLQRREQEVQRLHSELAALRRAQSQAGAASDAHAADLEIEITRLKQEAEQLRVQITASQRPKEMDLPEPTIELLDPKVPLTRGVKIVQTIEAENERVIVGHVDSPAGLMSLTVNDRSVDVTKKGIFRTQVVVGPEGTKVRIVATDRRGGMAERLFMLAPSPPAATVDARAEPSIDFGNYYALVIGNNAYAHPGLARLKTARADAEAIGGVLKNRFGFEVTTLLDATRYDILSALNKLRAQLTEKDNLLIFYAGHGELDRANSRGHWLPVDAEPDSTANWISNIALTDILNAMNARHIMVVADSCYSGSLTRSSLARLEAGMTKEAREAWMRGMVDKKSRTALTSGGMAPVLDSGGGGHSIFAKAVLDVLEETLEAIEGQRLFQLISARVAWAAEARAFEQLPQYAPIKYAGHESGDFFLVPQG